MNKQLRCHQKFISIGSGVISAWVPLDPIPSEYHGYVSLKHLQHAAGLKAVIDMYGKNSKQEAQINSALINPSVFRNTPHFLVYKLGRLNYELLQIDHVIFPDWKTYPDNPVVWVVFGKIISREIVVTSLIPNMVDWLRAGGVKTTLCEGSADRGDVAGCHVIGPATLEQIECAASVTTLADPYDNVYVGEDLALRTITMEEVQVCLQ